MNKEWSHLPNAEHIDWVLETLKTNPKVWVDAWKATGDAARNVAEDAARNATRETALKTTWDAAWDAVWDAAWDVMGGAARTAIEALIAWGDSGELLDMSVKEVTELAKAGNHAAVLLLPAVIVKNKLKENK